MTEILVGVGFFTIFVMALVAVIIAARAKLLPAGDVTIQVEDGPSFTTRPGGKLLDALAASDVRLPAACGGAGTCGMCRVRVIEGGGPILPIEREHVSRREARAGERLACQVPVRRAITVRLPPGTLDAATHRCRVTSARNVATFIREIAFELPPGDRFGFRAGEWVQIEAPPHHVAFRSFEIEERFRPAWERAGLLELESHVDEPTTRGYSLANAPEDPGLLLNVRIATPPPDAPAGTPPGRASSWLFSLREGDEATVAGPFGDFHVRETESEMVYVGGGAGMAPLRSHLRHLLLERRSTRRISYWYGARSLEEAFYREELEALAREHPSFRFELALSSPLPEDGWEGPTGFIHQVLYDHHLRDHPAPEDAEYYLCGPPLMIGATRRMLDDLGVDPENILFDDFGG